MSRTDRRLKFATLDDAVRELDRLAKARSLKTSGKWDWPQTLIHCAQSVEYSITGFPEPKSVLFQRTVGAAAFAVFSWRGRMKHNLAEPIPGAPPIPHESVVTVAMSQLLKAISDFRTCQEPLHPHFAYGALGKGEYERAHAMHMADHFSVFDIGA